MASLEDLKHVACARIDQLAGQLHDVSKAVWNEPELAYKEHIAHSVLCDFLQKQGFPVERKFHIETAFRASHGDCSDGTPHVAVISEYDALPEIGHACGHNLIAEVGVGAGIGIKAALEEAEKHGRKLGKVSVLGTPAEEDCGGKIVLIKTGVFGDIDISMMAHPSPRNHTREMMVAMIACVPGCPAEEGGAGGKIALCAKKAFSGLHLAMMAHPYCITNSRPMKFAMEVLNVKYTGKASHAAGAPWLGLNALDAAVMAYNNVSCLRQQMKPNWRIHGVITNGGTKPNIIPEETAMEYYIRAPSMGELQQLMAKVTKCFEAAAMATGCQVELLWEDHPYENMMTNETLASLYDVNATQVGVELCRDKEQISQATGSTDMGNVSHVVPSLHPMFYIGTSAMNHTREFTVAAGADKAQPYTIQQAKALAMTALDVLFNPELLLKIRAHFDEDKKKDVVLG